MMERHIIERAYNQTMLNYDDVPTRTGDSISCTH